MYTKTDLINSIAALGIKPHDTLLVHSSMTSVGEVEKGADTVLDAFIEYMKPGLLILPTHTWADIDEEYPVFNPLTEPSCVGILSNLFLKRPGVFRSWHPTHSVAALGRDAAAYTEGEECRDTPCPRGGCWGKLYDRKAKILFLGCSLKCNTLLHGVEEWNHIPGRLTDKPQQLKIITPEGQLIDRPLYRHQGNVFANYDKMAAPLFYTGVAQKGQIGDAVSVLCDAIKMVDLTTAFLARNPDLFADDLSVPTEWYV
jgi:aminoglycoside 3-N-acetyltransferase